MEETSSFDTQVHQPCEIDVYSEEWIDMGTDLEILLQPFIPELKLRLARFITEGQWEKFDSTVKVCHALTFLAVTYGRPGLVAFYKAITKCNATAAIACIKQYPQYALIWEDHPSPQEVRVYNDLILTQQLFGRSCASVLTVIAQALVLRATTQ